MSEVKLVPARMLLDKETIGAINFHCGDGGDNFGEHSDGLLWIGAVTDDEGKEVYGLHLATAEYPEEGSTTLVEFAEPLDAQRLRADTAEAENRDLRLQCGGMQMVLDEAKEKLAAAEQRIAFLSDVERVTMAILGKDKDPAPGINWFCNRAWTVNEVREIVRAALNPNPEAESHE